MLRKAYFLVCDVCGREVAGGVYNANGSTAASKDTRHRARALGWTRRDYRDLCERCR